MVRSEKFYIEFVALTVLSLLAANLWSRFMTRVLNTHTDSMSVDLIVAICMTFAAIIVMKTFFTPVDGKGVAEEPSYGEEMYESG